MTCEDEELNEQAEEEGQLLRGPGGAGQGGRPPPPLPRPEQEDRHPPDRREFPDQKEVQMVPIHPLVNSS